MSPEKGSPLSKQICLRYVLRHPVAFREFWTPQVSKRRFWHRYEFSPVLLSMPAGDGFLSAGRGTGKSFAVLEPELVRESIARPGEETLLSSLRRIHIVDRMERVIEYFEQIPLFKLFLTTVRRQPGYHLQLKNGHNLYGISVGDDPEAKMAAGKHASTIILEEAQQYPMRAWKKMQGAKDPRGSRTLMVGVPDGRLDTPFRQADGTYVSFSERRFHLSRRHDPYFDQRTKDDLASVYGGEDHDLFLQEVDAEWGQPVWSAWDLDSIYRCMSDATPRVVLELSGKAYRLMGMSAESACDSLPGERGARVRISMDVGYSQPSEIGVWRDDRGVWSLIARIRLVNRMEHDEQADVLREVALKYGAEMIGVDATEGEGRAICSVLEQDSTLGRRIMRVMFNERYVTGWRRDTEAEDAVEVKDLVRNIATQMLRAAFSKQLFQLPRDEDIAAEFNLETESRGSDGITRVLTPHDVHITDMFRVFGFMLFLEHPPQPPTATEEGQREFVMPEWSDRQSPWASTMVV